MSPKDDLPSPNTPPAEATHPTMAPPAVPPSGMGTIDLDAGPDRWAPTERAKRPPLDTARDAPPRGDSGGDKPHRLVPPSTAGA